MLACPILRIAHSAGATQLATFTYGYTPRGDLTSYSGPEGAVTFAYDDTRQLTSATGARSDAYSYDANGNRTLAGYTTGVNNRLLSDGVYNFEYDDEGNRTRRTHIATGETHDYSWDHRNRLTKVIIKNSGGAIIREARFTYDVDNNLIVRWTDPDGAGAQAADQLFTAYDGMHAYADFDASSALTQRYLYGDQPDQLLAVIEADGDPNFPLTDNLGSVRQCINALGVVLNETTFDSFGNILTETNPSAAIRQSFTGRELERSIGLYWYRARWYDPAAGRFVSEDPIDFHGGDSNLVRYVSNSPTILTDPSGRDGQVVIGTSCKTDVGISRGRDSVWDWCKPPGPCNVDGVFVHSRPVKNTKEGPPQIKPCPTHFVKIVDGCTAYVECDKNGPYISKIVCNFWSLPFQDFTGGCCKPLGDNRLNKFPKDFDPAKGVPFPTPTKTL